MPAAVANRRDRSTTGLLRPGGGRDRPPPRVLALTLPHRRRPAQPCIHPPAGAGRLTMEGPDRRFAAEQDRQVQGVGPRPGAGATARSSWRPGRCGGCGCCKLGQSVHVVLLSMHHIISDGWSIGVLVRELAAACTGPSPRANSSPLPDLPAQYADYAVWQRQWLQGEAAADSAGLLEAAAGRPWPPLELPSDRPRPAVPTVRGAPRCC